MCERGIIQRALCGPVGHVEWKGDEHRESFKSLSIVRIDPRSGSRRTKKGGINNMHSSGRKTYGIHASGNTAATGRILVGVLVSSFVSVSSVALVTCLVKAGGKIWSSSSIASSVRSLADVD